jgi:drug/metabolite transporter (DMT)-like permease
MAVSDRIAGNAVGVACMVLWATNFPVSEEILATWHPLLLTPVRIGLAGLVVVLAAVAVAQGRETLLLLANPRMLASGLAFGVSSIFFVTGQKYTDAVSASVIVSAMPLFSAVMGWMAGRERFTGGLVAALLLALIGGTLTSASGGGSQDGSLLGAASILAGTVLYVWYSRMIVDEFSDAPILAKTAASTLAGAALTTLAVGMAWTFGWFEPQYELSPRTLALVGWLGFAIGASAVLWFWVGRKIGVTVASVHNNLVPFYVILMAAMAGAAVSGQQLVGATLVVAAAVLAQWPSADLKSRPEDA